MTTLYIKTHNITGLKYFGKTILEDVHGYTGSGKYWSHHIKKHGYDVTTEIYAQFEDNTLLQECALKFSEENNIVKSKKWANLRPENGLDGTVPGTKFSDETKRKHSEARSGEKHWNYGKVRSEVTKKKIKLSLTGTKKSEESKEKTRQSCTGLTHTNETKEKMSATQKNKPRVTCPHCQKIGAANLMTRYHLDNCRYKEI